MILDRGSSDLAEFVEIIEVGPRDGLQNEVGIFDTSDKIRMIDALSVCGFRRIEVASFVHPRRVPQMADGEDVLMGITKKPNVRYAALTPNQRGLQRAISSGVDEVAVFASASEGFSMANINRTVAVSLRAFRELVREANKARLPVRGYVSCAVSCPYDGPTSPDRVTAVAAELMGMGCYEVSLGDTLGKGRPVDVHRMLDRVLAEIPAAKVAGHFHDTGGYALANIEASLEKGIRAFDSSVGGLGGCPFAPGAAGNVATEDMNRRLLELGFQTGIDSGLLERARHIVADILRKSAREIDSHT